MQTKTNMIEAAAQLSAVCPHLSRVIAQIGPLPPPTSPYREPYDALISAVAHQQLHSKAALAILARLRQLCGLETLPPPDTLLALPFESLRACGFSGNKIAAIQDIAAKAKDKTIPTRAGALRLSDEQLIERLTTIRGVGRWTVEMLLIFTLGRPDIFPVDDFGVREGFRLTQNLNLQPKPKALALIAQAYAPHRSIAARYYWRAADATKKVKYTE